MFTTKCPARRGQESGRRRPQPSAAPALQLRAARLLPSLTAVPSAHKSCVWPFNSTSRPGEFPHDRVAPVTTALLAGCCPGEMMDGCPSVTQRPGPATWRPLPPTCPGPPPPLRASPGPGQGGFQLSALKPPIPTQARAAQWPPIVSPKTEHPPWDHPACPVALFVHRQEAEGQVQRLSETEWPGFKPLPWVWQPEDSSRQLSRPLPRGGRREVLSG